MTKRMLEDSSRVAPKRPDQRVRSVEVGRIRPEEGLGRKRDREGHRELSRSIAQFGVLTPITVRPAPDGSGDYLLIKGQGRTLACRMLGLRRIPAIVVDESFSDTEKVQQFLVENVARMRMRPIDRALLIARARALGEETTQVAERFGVSATTVRKLEMQLEGATSGEVEALRSGGLTLSAHAVIAKYAHPDERLDVIGIVRDVPVTAKELESLFIALGWTTLVDLGLEHRGQRIALLRWACEVLHAVPRGDLRGRLSQVALELPIEIVGSAEVDSVRA